MATAARFLVLWDTPQDPVEFERHYREVHVPLSRKLPGLRRYVLGRNVAPIRGDESYYLVAELDFDDMASLQAAFRSPEGRRVAANAGVLAAGTGVRSMVFEVEDVG
ncbi:EthD family reductase [Streptacidiphilus rugosus]|uniref:EthD family reductase n=1 Tax=Streptacidiphilus rugosus TaxID=405783 RepID=UPI00055D555B|nr:EthD family reductase [Streptacidiphilus rugosus]